MFEELATLGRPARVLATACWPSPAEVRWPGQDKAVSVSGSSVGLGGKKGSRDRCIRDLEKRGSTRRQLLRTARQDSWHSVPSVTAVTHSVSDVGNSI